MGLFGPNIKKLREKNDLDGLNKVALETRNPTVLKEAIESMAMLGGDKANAILVQIIILNSNWLEAQTIDEKSLAFLTDENYACHSLKRIYAMEALKNVIDHRIENILTALNRPDLGNYGRSALLSTLGKSKDDRALNMLTDSLKNRDIVVKIAVVEALGSFGSPRALKNLIDEFNDEALSNDPNFGLLNMMILDAIGQIGGVDSLSFLLELSTHSDGTVRAGADKAIMTIRSSFEREQQSLLKELGRHKGSTK